MIKADRYMIESIENILKYGHLDVNPRPHYEDGTPAHTLSVNSVMHQYDISQNEFPITTLRPIYFKKAIGELLWIYQDASNDLNVLRDKYNVTWWDEWDIGNRTIGSCYGETVRRHDLVHKLLDGIKKDPYGRRHIINLWQEEDFKEPHGLKPCCYQTQFLVRGEYIDMILYQRSSDWLTAGNINQMQYVAFMMMVARHCGYKAGIFTHFIANQQIYDRHVKNALEMKSREPIDCNPVLILNSNKTDFYSMTVDDFILDDYKANKPQLKFDLGI